MTMWQKSHMATTHDLRSQMREAYALMEQNHQDLQQQISQYNQSLLNLINQHSQNHQNQLSKLTSMNEVFSKSLSDVLTITTDKLIAQVKADTDTAMKANVQNVASIVETMKMASTNVANKVIDFEKKLDAALKRPQTTLDNHIKSYRDSMKKLFKVDGWREVFFWAGLWGSIAMPILLVLNLIFRF